MKDEVYRVAGRYGLDVTLVANSWMNVPAVEWITLEVVRSGLDAADDWIVERAGPSDIVITADIPLASRCLSRGALVVSPGGKALTEDNIGDAVATRDLLSELRSAGEHTAGPPPLERRDRSLFLQRLDAAVRSAQRANG